jgi:cytochrome c oxidase subunit 4
MADHPPHQRDNPFEPDEHPEHGVGHVVQPKILITTALALLVLTVVTVSAAKIDFSQLDLNELNIFVALAIAVVKATLVCLFFMHLRWDRPFNAFVLIGSLVLVGLFISFAMTDSSEYRVEVIQGDSDVIDAKIAEVQKVSAATDASHDAASAGPSAPH